MNNCANLNREVTDASDGLPAFLAATWSLSQDKILAVLISVLFSLNF